VGNEFAAVARRQGRRRWVWPLAMVAGLVLVGRVLVGELGSPVRLLRALGDIGSPWADPVTPMISLLALLAETLIAYMLVLLGLRSLCLLPGSIGRVAERVSLLVTPVAVKRVLDLLVGGTLLAQATLVASSGMLAGHRGVVPALPMATSSISIGNAAPVTGYGQAAIDPSETRPAPRRTSAPLPPWLGGGSSNPVPESIGGTGNRATGDAERGPAGKADPGSSGAKEPGSSGEPEPRSSDANESGSTGGAAPGSSGAVVAGYTVAVGDTLWDIAAAHLGSGERTVVNVHRYWRQVYRANRQVIGTDPDLIHPGTRLHVPPFRRDRP
jgi:nucleoid-associated protein YgaU